MQNIPPLTAIGSPAVPENFFPKVSLIASFSFAGGTISNAIPQTSWSMCNSWTVTNNTSASFAVQVCPDWVNGSGSNWVALYNPQANAVVSVPPGTSVPIVFMVGDAMRITSSLAPVSGSGTVSGTVALLLGYIAPLYSRPWAV